MKPKDVFCAVLKATGVVFWVYALEGLPAAIRYSPYFYKVDTTVIGLSDGANAYWQVALTRSAMFLVFGCLFVFGTNLLARLAYGSTTPVESEKLN
jgi:hypothetical protein